MLSKSKSYTKLQFCITIQLGDVRLVFHLKSSKQEVDSLGLSYRKRKP